MNRRLFLMAGLGAMLCAAQSSRVLLVSIDGLDYRYLRDCDKLGLRIPVLRGLMKTGEVTEGVVGVVPTVTWPSHTTMITGVTPAVHGILSNRRPPSEGGDYYWDVSLLKVKTLWHAARQAGKKTGAITWPVTVGADIDFNLPERFGARNGGAMDLQSIEEKSTPGLVDKIRAKYPSFSQQWMNDRTRALAAMYMLEHEKPDLLMIHFVDLDSEAHEKGPFTREANAVLEYTDELLGQVLAKAPRDTVIALVSDHGFERVDRVVEVNRLLADDGAPGTAESAYGLLVARDAAVAAKLKANPARYAILREVPSSEYLPLAASLKGAAAVFEPAEHVAWSMAKTPTARHPKGEHGLWPNRKDYMSSLILAGPGIRAGKKPQASMLTIAPRLAEIMGLRFEPGK